MRTGKRKKPTRSVETQVLQACRRRCCLCYFLRDDRGEKSGQIAHLNRDSSDSKLENLVWLCLEHHDTYDSKTSQSKNYTVNEVTDYRDKLNQEFGTISHESRSDPTQLLEDYKSRFRQTYGHLAATLVSYELQIDERVVPVEQVFQAIVTGTNTQLVGPSGCGKSLTSLAAAIVGIERNVITVFARAKDFCGDLRQVLDQEARSLGAPDISSLLEACSDTGTQVLVVVDGFNECLDQERGRLLNSLITEASDASATVLISAQTPIDTARSLSLEHVVIGPPSTELKRRLAGLDAVSGQLYPHLDALLEVAQTGVEAVLVGQIGKELPSLSSRFATFDLFVRKRMAPDETLGVHILSAIADHLTQSISFSLSIREVDRVLNNIDRDGKGLTMALDSGILARRGDRVSFGHELFLDAYASEAVVRSSRDDVAKILEALKSPRHKARRPLILGAIEGEEILLQVLGALDDCALLGNCLSGSCGEIPRSWAKRRANELLDAAAAEASQVAFLFGEDGWVQVSPETLHIWTPQDAAILAATGEMPFALGYLERLLELASIFDMRLDVERSRLRHDLRAKGVGLRSMLFREAFFVQKTLGISFVFGDFQHRFGLRKESVPADLDKHLERDDLTPGQLYLLLKLHGSRDLAVDRLTPRLAKLLDRYWTTAPYHLKLELLQAVEYSSPADEQVWIELVKAMNTISGSMDPIVGSSWVDAMARLGAFEEDESAHVEQVRTDLQHCLAHPENHESRIQAFSIWLRQIDHPYSGAYSQALGELPTNEMRTFLAMACMGTENAEMFVGSLLAELGRFSDPSFDAVFRHWTHLPKRDSSMHQFVVETFVYANAILGKLTCPPPTVAIEGEPDSAHAMAACGELLYWANRRDLSAAEFQTACTIPQALLRRHELGVSADVIWLVRNSILVRGSTPQTDDPVTCVVEAFPGLACEVYRKCLNFSGAQRGYFPHFGQWELNEVMQFGMRVLGQFGDLNDLPLLKSYADHADLGSAALLAIRSIRSRT